MKAYKKIEEKKEHREALDFIRNRRASVFDILVVVYMLFLGTLGIYVSYYLIVSVQALNPFQGDANATQCLEYGRQAIQYFDYVALSFFFSISFLAIILAFYVKSHPVFFVVTWLALLIVVFVTVVITNVYYNLASTAAFATTVEAFPLLYSLWTNMPALSLLMSLLIAIVMHSKIPNPFGGEI